MEFGKRGERRAVERLEREAGRLPVVGPTTRVSVFARKTYPNVVEAAPHGEEASQISRR